MQGNNWKADEMLLSIQKKMLQKDKCGNFLMKSEVFTRTLVESQIKKKLIKNRFIALRKAIE